MCLIVSIFFPIITIELAVIIWLLFRILDEIEELEREKPPFPRPFPFTRCC